MFKKMFINPCNPLIIYPIQWKIRIIISKNPYHISLSSWLKLHRLFPRKYKYFISFHKFQLQNELLNHSNSLSALSFNSFFFSSSFSFFNSLSHSSRFLHLSSSILASSSSSFSCLGPQKSSLHLIEQ